MTKKKPPLPRTETGQIPCSVCLVLRAGEVPLIGRYSLDGEDIIVCDKCLNTILILRESPETEGMQWNWTPIREYVNQFAKEKK